MKANNSIHLPQSPVVTIGESGNKYCCGPCIDNSNRPNLILTHIALETNVTLCHLNDPASYEPGSTKQPHLKAKETVNVHTRARHTYPLLDPVVTIDLHCNKCSSKLGWIYSTTKSSYRMDVLKCTNVYKVIDVPVKEEVIDAPGKEAMSR